MKHPATRELFAYWNDLRGGRAAPERSEINPATIRGVLADTFMLDVDLDRRFPFRLAGTRVNALFEAEQKGKAFLDLWKGEERRNIAAILLTVADGACPVVAGGHAAPNGESETALEMLLLPLRHHGRTHSRILGLVVPVSKPSWLGMLPPGPVSLRSLRMIDPLEIEDQEIAARIAVGQSADPTPMDAPILGISAVRAGRPHLRVIQGGL